ncbi:MAG: dihydrolipoamide acetyltransferase family protein [Gemmatimonadota bacterium]|nr:dihydrolipoamide acetyltransferase family protein [Gemmatimonadota bacterium]
MYFREPEPEFTLKALSPIRKAIAKRVSYSLREIPQFDLHLEIDASALKAARTGFLTGGGDIVPGYNDMIICCCAKVLEKHPALNAHFTGEGIREFHEVNIGFAVATGQGVFLPVIRKAETKSILEIAGETAEMSKLARKVKLRASAQMHGTFTVSSLGGFGIDSFNAVISPPQVAILAVGAVIEKPRVRLGKITPAPVLHLTLTVDHRAVDGAGAAGFLKELKQVLENFAE